MAGQAVRIEVHVQPGARRDEVLGFREGALWVKIAAPPIEGKANRGLVKLLSGILGVSKSHLAIERGGAGRYKTVAITSVQEEQVMEILARASSHP